MELRPGYQQTEVGVIPEDWEVKRLSDITDLQVGFPFKSAWFGYDLGMRLLRGENVGYGRADWSDTRTLEGESPEPYRQYLLAADDIIIGMDRTFTKSGTKVTRLGSTDCPSLLVQRVGRFNARGCQAAFLWQLLNYGPLISRLRGEQKGMDIPHLSRSEILRPLTVLPPLPEQRAIAEALSDVDELIASLERLIAKKRDLKRGAMQQLLTGKTRLPGFSGDWETKRLGEIARLYQPETISQAVFTSDGYPVYGANGVVGRFPRYNHATQQITVSCRGNCGTVNRTSGPAWITGNAMVINLDGACGVDHSFVYYALCHSDLTVLTTGSGIPQIVRGPLEGFEIRLPVGLSEQSAIASVLSDMDAELAALEARRDKTKLLKQGMMQELLTGKTRLV